MTYNTNERASALLQKYKDGLLLSAELNHGKPSVWFTEHIAEIDACLAALAGREPAPETPDDNHREHYRAGYSAGWSDGRNGLPMQDALKASMFFGPEICSNCGGMGTTTHDILVGGTEHDTEERECDICKGTGEKPLPPRAHRETPLSERDLYRAFDEPSHEIPSPRPQEPKP